MKNCIMLGDRVADAGKEMQRRGDKLYETEVIFYTDAMHDELEWATRIKAYVDTAIENDEFSYGVEHSLIDFELTESSAYDNRDYMLNMLVALKERGFKISMDDFGTGYSSLGLLTEMPMDTIKIDKSFVDKIGNEKENAKEYIVIKSIIEMARELGFICLAEGAEKKEQVDKLKEFGCEIVQGYYFSKPLPVEEYEQKLNY